MRDVAVTLETKADRRARILTQARMLLSMEGFEGLSLRKLAARAGLTVPTIYNLVGGKEQVLLELALQMIASVETALDDIEESQPLERAEAIVLVAIAEIERAPDFHRAALLAIDHLDRNGSPPGWDRLSRQAAAMQEKATVAAQRIGLLEGQISASLIAEQIFRTYRSASRDWSVRRCSLPQFRRMALAGVYLGFAADASPGLRPVLARKLKKLERSPARITGMELGR